MVFACIDKTKFIVSGQSISHLRQSCYTINKFKRHMDMGDRIFMSDEKRKESFFTIKNTEIQHGEDMYDVLRLAIGMTLDEPCEDCTQTKFVKSQLERFAEGQFVAVLPDDTVIGFASTMRIHHTPDYDPNGRWMDHIGSLHLPNHDPNGEWMYGVEMAVHPDYQRKGVGTALYKARFEMVKRLNLRGWYAVGMLMGYHRYQDKMTVREYGEKVISGDIIDPTVTMQKNRGFHLVQVVEDYLDDEPKAGDSGVLIVWENPEYREG